MALAHGRTRVLNFSRSLRRCGATSPRRGLINWREYNRYFGGKAGYNIAHQSTLTEKMAESSPADRVEKLLLKYKVGGHAVDCEHQ